MRYFVGPEGRDEYMREPCGRPVIIDVLRASSTIVTAFAHGAARIIPVGDYGEALALARSEDALTIGELHGIKVEGFDYGNSPTEISRVPLKGRTIVMVTTNGTHVMVEDGIIAGTLNAGAVAEKIHSQPHAFLLASGAPEKSDEDLYAARLIELIAAKIGRGDTRCDAVASAVSGEEGARLLADIRQSTSGKKLASYGYGKDIDLICTAVDGIPLVPVYRAGEIKI